MVTTMQKPIVDTQEIKKKKSKHTTIEHQITNKTSKRRRKKLQNNQKSINKMAISTYLSIITLNVNGINPSIIRYRVAEWIKQGPSICCLLETCFRSKDTHRLKVKG